MNTKNQLIIVSGNKSGDLDSLISAFVKSELIRIEKPKEDIIFTLFNFIKKDLSLRPEAVYMINELSISLENVIFSDSMKIQELEKYDLSDNLEIILTDHNNPELPLSKFSKDIIEIIDHHKDSSSSNKKIIKTIDHTGSCSTLVGEQFIEMLNRPGLILNKNKRTLLSNLLYTAIYVDTVHLEEQSGYNLYRDRVILDKLKAYISINSTFLQNIISEKFNVKNFTAREHLRKDSKNWYINNIHYGISTVYTGIENIIKNYRDWENSVKVLLAKEDYQVLFMMHFIKEPILKRELTVTFSDSFRFKDELLKMISRSTVFKEIKNDQYKGSSFSFFLQLHPDSSRKKIQPFLEEQLTLLKE